MTTRTFTVFEDASPVKKRPSTRPLGRSVSAGAVLTASHRRSENININTISLPEKENMHPVTGAHIGASSSSGKKRKASESSTVLAPKVLGVASDASGSAKSKPKRTELKRKASSQTGSGKAKVKKESSKKGGEERNALSDVRTTPSTPSTKPASRTGLRSVSTPILATIEEEPTVKPAHEDASESEAREITQAQIDSRCYELTVSPLADVSDAYIQPTEEKEPIKDEEPLFSEATKEELDFMTQIRDFFHSDDSHIESQSSSDSLPSLPTPLFSAADELDVFSSFNFDDLVAKDNTPKSAPVTPKKNRRLIRSLSLPNTPTKDSTKQSGVAKLPIAPLTLPALERKQLNAEFTFTSPFGSPTRTL